MSKGLNLMANQNKSKSGKCVNFGLFSVKASLFALFALLLQVTVPNTWLTANRFTVNSFIWIFVLPWAQIIRKTDSAEKVTEHFST